MNWNREKLICMFSYFGPYRFYRHDEYLRLNSLQNMLFSSIIQVMPVVKFVNKFLDENPLCVCSEEISSVKRDLMSAQDEIKLKQKQSQVTLRIVQDGYFFHVRFTIPDKYYTDMLK